MPALRRRPRVLVVEDDPPLREAYRRFFEERCPAEFRASYVADGEQALGVIGREPVDVVVLDWVLPGISGPALARALRSHRMTRSVGIVMVTAKTTVGDTVRGLDAGADDYLPKPFDWDVLLARLRSLFRRSELALAEHMKREFPGLSLDLDAERLSVDGVPVPVGPKEFALLRVFLERPGIVHSREFLWEAAWGVPRSEGWERSLTVAVSSLRRKLGPRWGERLSARPGSGYRFDPPA